MRFTNFHITLYYLGLLFYNITMQTKKPAPKPFKTPVEPPPSLPHKELKIQGFFFLAVLCLIAYHNSFQGVFLMDDTYHIVNNPRIRHLLPLSGVVWSFNSLLCAWYAYKTHHDCCADISPFIYSLFLWQKRYNCSGVLLIPERCTEPVEV